MLLDTPPQKRVESRLGSASSSDSSHRVPLDPGSLQKKGQKEESRQESMNAASGGGGSTSDQAPDSWDSAKTTSIRSQEKSDRLRPLSQQSGKTPEDEKASGNSDGTVTHGSSAVVSLELFLASRTESRKVSGSSGETGCSTSGIDAADPVASRTGSTHISSDRTEVDSTEPLAESTHSSTGGGDLDRSVASRTEHQPQRRKLQEAMPSGKKSRN